jgi:hypothetical protein
MLVYSRRFSTTSTYFAKDWDESTIRICIDMTYPFVKIKKQVISLNAILMPKMTIKVMSVNHGKLRVLLTLRVKLFHFKTAV